MSVRKKIFGSLFILACIAVVVVVVMLVVKPGSNGGATEDEAFLLEPLPEFDLSLSGLTGDPVPDISLPDLPEGFLFDADVTVPDIGVAAPGTPDISAGDIPSMSLDMGEIQQLMEDALK